MDGTEALQELTRLQEASARAMTYVGLTGGGGLPPGDDDTGPKGGWHNPRNGLMASLADAPSSLAIRSVVRSTPPPGLTATIVGGQIAMLELAMAQDLDHLAALFRRLEGEAPGTQAQTVASIRAMAVSSDQSAIRTRFLEWLSHFPDLGTACARGPGATDPTSPSAMRAPWTSCAGDAGLMVLGAAAIAVAVATIISTSGVGLPWCGNVFAAGAGMITAGWAVAVNSGCVTGTFW